MPGRVSPDIAVVVPTRGRPRSVGRLLAAWHATCAFDDGARLVLAVDSDDPASTEYEKVLEELQRTFPQNAVSLLCTGRWQPLVPKLNRIARLFVDESFALGFMGDDHLPRTVHWVRIVGGTLSQMGTGIVYGNDLLQGKHLPTAWIMTSDIVGVLGAMVPAPVEHLYCDDTILALGREARCIQYLPEVVIEHLHPYAGKAVMDSTYWMANSATQRRRDYAAFQEWLRSGLSRDAARISKIRSGREVGRRA